MGWAAEGGPFHLKSSGKDDPIRGRSSEECHSRFSSLRNLFVLSFLEEPSDGELVDSNWTSLGASS